MKVNGILFVFWGNWPFKVASQANLDMVLGGQPEADQWLLI